MEIATNTSALLYSVDLVSGCIAVGGTPVASGACLCPYGLTSGYDALVSGVFCSIPSQYGDVEYKTSTNSSETGSEEFPIVVTLSGAIQLIVSFALSMLLVCIVRRASRCCRKTSQPDGPNLSRAADPYWYS